MPITIETVGLDKVTDNVEAAIKRAKNLKPALDPSAQTLEGVIKKDAFRKGQTLEGVKWDDLAESTKAARRKNNRAMLPLIDTGQLMGAVKAKATKTYIVVGVSGAPATYAGTHQYGHRFKWGKVPARPFLPLESSGEAVFTAGPGLKWWKRTSARVAHYIATGEVK